MRRERQRLALSLTLLFLWLVALLKMLAQASKHSRPFRADTLARRAEAAQASKRAPPFRADTLARTAVALLLFLLCAATSTAAQDDDGDGSEPASSDDPLFSVLGPPGITWFDRQNDWSVQLRRSNVSSDFVDAYDPPLADAGFFYPTTCPTRGQ